MSDADSIVSELPEQWRRRASELDAYAPPAARAFREAAGELELALRAQDQAILTVPEAARISGFAQRTLRERISSGALENLGQKGSPRVRRSDLPRKARSKATLSRYDPADDARTLLAGADR